MTPEQVLEREGLALPMSHPVVANYAKTVRTGALVFVSAHGSFVDGTPAHIGRVGAELTLESGRRAAEAVMMNILGTLKRDLRELSRISRLTPADVPERACDGWLSRS
jgi:hypothetical protein